MALHRPHFPPSHPSFLLCAPVSWRVVATPPCSTTTALAGTPDARRRSTSRCRFSACNDMSSTGGATEGVAVAVGMGAGWEMWAREGEVVVGEWVSTSYSL